MEKEILDTIQKCYEYLFNNIRKILEYNPPDIFLSDIYSFHFIIKGYNPYTPVDIYYFVSPKKWIVKLGLKDSTGRDFKRKKTFYSKNPAKAIEKFIGHWVWCEVLGD